MMEQYQGHTECPGCGEPTPTYVDEYGEVRWVHDGPEGPECPDIGKVPKEVPDDDE